MSFPIELIVSLLVVVAIGTYVLQTYNRLVRLRMNADKQTSHVQVHLKKKFDLIPALVDIVKGYAKHEKGTFEEIARLRSQWAAAKSTDETLKAANLLDSALSRLLIVQERYPQLKADRSFMNIQQNMSGIERELVHERKIYNKRVSYYNMALQQFPSLLVGKLFKFEEKSFFKLDAGDNTDTEF